MDAKEWIKEIQKEDRNRKRDNADVQTFDSENVKYILRDIIKTEQKRAWTW